MTINTERVQDLVNALRSGEYKQTTEALKSGDCYCVLGVACEISGVGEFIQNPRRQYLEEYKAGGTRSTSQLPFVVACHYGFPDGDPYIETLPNGDQGASLSTLNDDRGYTFDMLADVIEHEYLIGA